MYLFQPQRLVWSAVLLSLLLVSLMLPSPVSGDYVHVTSNQTLNNPPPPRGISSELNIEFRSKVPTQFNLNGLTFDTRRITVTTKKEWNGTAIFSAKGFTLTNCHFTLVFDKNPYSMMNFSDGTSRFFTLQYLHLIGVFGTLGVGTRVYVKNVQILASRGSVLTLGDTVKGMPVAQTGFYLSQISSAGSRSFFYDLSGLSTQFETISVDNSECTGCTLAFYVSTSKWITTNLLRFVNCTHTQTSAFFWQAPNSVVTIADPIGGIILLENSNLVLSNITSKGPLIEINNTGKSSLTSTSRVTLFNITAPSLYVSGASGPLFSTVPNGAQVYVGPMKLNDKVYTSYGEYQGLNIPFTRVINMDGVVLYLVPGRARGVDVGDKSKVGEVAASHCTNNGYSKMDWRLDPTSRTKKFVCICYPDRFVPHCSTTWDPLGVSLCPTNSTPSEATFQCIPCSVDHCKQCNEANKCVACESGYSLDGQSKCTTPFPNCEILELGNTKLCSKCNDKFSLSVGKLCVPTITDCEEYTDSGTCSKCKPGLSPSLSGRTCVDCNLDDCIMCSADRKCAGCKTGYSLVNDGCVSCSVEKCTLCEVADKCKTCIANYLPNGDGSCSYKIPHCEQSLTETQCSKCESGYSLSADKTACVPSIKNCIEYSNVGTCNTCEKGLSPSGDRLACVKCSVEHCALCDEKGECIYCEERYSLAGLECISCNVDNCTFCYEEDKCGGCNWNTTCTIGGEPDTSKGIPWWVWLIVGLAAAVVVGLIIFFVVWCCFCTEGEFFVTYQEQYNEEEEKNGNRDRRLWDRNGDISGDEHGAMFIVNDAKRPRVFKQDEGTTHGEGSSFASSDSCSSSSGSNNSSSSQKSSSSNSDSSTDSEASK